MKKFNKIMIVLPKTLINFLKQLPSAGAYVMRR